MAVITLVLAMTRQGVIGDRGGIPWHIPDDLRRFKSLTMGKPVVMGRKTWDSLPKRPLPGRSNIVITQQPGWRADGALAVHSLAEALAAAGAESPEQIMIIGGAQIYREALPFARRIELTLVDREIAGDTMLAPFDPKVWRQTFREDRQTPDGLGYAYVSLERVGVPR